MRNKLHAFCEDKNVLKILEGWILNISIFMKTKKHILAKSKTLSESNTSSLSKFYMRHRLATSSSSFSKDDEYVSSYVAIIAFFFGSPLLKYFLRRGQVDLIWPGLLHSQQLLFFFTFFFFFFLRLFAFSYLWNLWLHIVCMHILLNLSNFTKVNCKGCIHFA